MYYQSVLALSTIWELAKKQQATETKHWKIVTGRSFNPDAWVKWQPYPDHGLAALVKLDAAYIVKAYAQCTQAPSYKG